MPVTTATKIKAQRRLMAERAEQIRIASAITQAADRIAAAFARPER